MVSWAPSRRAKMERIEAEAELLIRDLGDGAYHEARRREHEASSDVIAQDWAHGRAGGRAPDGQPDRPQHLDAAGDEHLLRA